MALRPGTRLGRYDVAALIGEGGMGEVWQATDTQLQRTVAIKVLGKQDEEAAARLLQEARPTRKQTPQPDARVPASPGTGPIARSP